MSQTRESLTGPGDRLPPAVAPGVQPDGRELARRTVPFRAVRGEAGSIAQLAAAPVTARCRPAGRTGERPATAGRGNGRAGHAPLRASR